MITVKLTDDMVDWRDVDADEGYLPLYSEPYIECYAANMAFIAHLYKSVPEKVVAMFVRYHSERVSEILFRACVRNAKRKGALPECVYMYHADIEEWVDIDDDFIAETEDALSYGEFGERHAAELMPIIS